MPVSMLCLLCQKACFIELYLTVGLSLPQVLFEAKLEIFMLLTIVTLPSVRQFAAKNISRTIIRTRQILHLRISFHY